MNLPAMAENYQASDMDMEILKIKDSGELFRESIVLKVTRDCDISSYILISDDYESIQQNNYSADPTNTFCMPRITVNKGDYINIYSRPGVPYTHNNKVMTKTHNLFFGADHVMWSDNKYAILAKINNH